MSPALAGPPLVCFHSISNGDVAALEFLERSQGMRSDYDLDRLNRDTIRC
jgi:hypothetical protein